jgi:hypothetical protein
MTAEQNVFKNSEGMKQMGLLKGSRYAKARYLRRTKTCDVGIEEYNGTVQWLIYTGDSIEQGCLAGTVRTYEALDSTFLYREANAGKGH